MGAINLRNIVKNKQLGSMKITIIRTHGDWIDGRFELNLPQQLQISANIQPATPEELEQLPEGDRLKGMIVIRSKYKMYETQETETENFVSDIIHWHQKTYKIVQVNDWSHHGYYEAFAMIQGVIN